MKPTTLPQPSESTMLDSFLATVREALLLQTVTIGPVLLTVEECLARARCSKAHFYRHVRRHLHRTKSRPYRYTRASLDAYLNGDLVDAHGQEIYKREAKRRTITKPRR